MENKLQRLVYLLERYESGQATTAEVEEMLEDLKNAQDDEAIEKVFVNLLETQTPIHSDPEQLKALARRIMREGTGKVVTMKKTPVIRRFRWVAAAVIVLLAVSTVFLLNRKNGNTEIAIIQKDIKAPEKNKATITLPDGRQIVLDTVANGTLIAGVVRKTADGELVIEGDANIPYLIAHNPRSSKALHIELPDHTEVWLNAETDLKYPTSFKGNERLVDLKGEAFFEVVHNLHQPFKVIAGDQTIEDVGTSFNVKAYAEDNSTATTLVEGIVKINQSTTLKPGEQFLNNKVVKANTDEVLAWKNGSFYLDQRELGAVANELGRWYDVAVVFENEKAKRSIVFGGEMGRNLTLLEAIEFLERMKVKCRLEDKKLIIE
ncbi:MAG: FecR domain-containing protein [Bacteroidota bacterium]